MFSFHSLAIPDLVPTTLFFSAVPCNFQNSGKVEGGDKRHQGKRAISFSDFFLYLTTFREAKSNSITMILEI